MLNQSAEHEICMLPDMEGRDESLNIIAAVEDAVSPSSSIVAGTAPSD